MRLYQIPLPIFHNDGSGAGNARKRFLDRLLGYCGGYTLLPVANGAWQDPATGKVYREPVEPVQFAYDAATLPACTFAAILQSFQDCYPDQICAMVADLGEVTFHTFKQEETV